jgi:PST family polysaccharide transporter
MLSRPNPLTIASVLLLLLAPMALTISAGAANLVAILLGNRWSAAAPLVAIAAGQCVFQPFIQVAGAALVARGHVRGQFVVTAVSAALRAVFVTLAALTGSLTMVIVATSAALGSSALLYAYPLQSDLKGELGGFLASLARIALASTAAGLMLIALGFGWEPAKNDLSWHVAPFVNLGLLTAIVAATYATTLLVLWFAFGRPNGPERIVLNLLQEFTPVRWLSGIHRRRTRTPLPHVP